MNVNVGTVIVSVATSLFTLSEMKINVTLCNWWYLRVGVYS